ncbi:glycerol transporter [Bifidobacterium primatium]|uniref:Glycerol transporter n=1 Tax=Bifidobacterium primatium TaxID=2045438 RepID=A0A2M9H7S9_9BIFI|nr:aquaporin [Bifidobacterium primatium]PJM72862.1 glycerol transporter [Bifidobacterium primatium]
MQETSTLSTHTCHPKELSSSPVVRVLSEFAGTFFACFVIYTAGTYGTVLYGANVLFVALATALAYAASTAVFGRFSGGHFNPAVTLAAVLTSRTSWIDGILYVLAQVAGGIAAGFLIMGILPTSSTVTSTMWFTSAVNGYGDGSPSNSMLSQAGISFNYIMALAVEVVMAILVVAAATVTLRENGSPAHTHTLATGLAYGAAVAVAYAVTGAGLNPARSTGIAIVAQGKGLTVEPLSQLWLFWVCPLLGGALVALAVLLTAAIGQSRKQKAVADVPVDSSQDPASDDAVEGTEADENAETENGGEPGDNDNDETVESNDETVDVKKD